jgi:hypothetical protein
MRFPLPLFVALVFCSSRLIALDVITVDAAGDVLVNGPTTFTEDVQGISALFGDSSVSVSSLSGGNALHIKGNHISDGDGDYGLTIESYQPALTLVDRSTGSGQGQIAYHGTAMHFLTDGANNDGTIGYSTNSSDQTMMVLSESRHQLRIAGTNYLQIRDGVVQADQDILFQNKALIAALPDYNKDGGNIDHIWHDDSINTWFFISDSTYKNRGGGIRQGAFIANHYSNDNIDHIWHDDATNTWYLNSDSPYKALGTHSNLVVDGITVKTLAVSESLTAPSKNFLIDHPLDPNNTELIHGSIEAPRYEVVYRGTTELTDGTATVSIDKASNMRTGTFTALTQNPQVFLQNNAGWDLVRGTVEKGQLVIESNNSASNDTIDWMVVAERADATARALSTTDDAGHLIVERPKATAR